MSITKHDSIDSYHVARDYGQKQDIHLITEIEWNTHSPQNDFHIHGYGIELSCYQERNNTRNLI